MLKLLATFALVVIFATKCSASILHWQWNYGNWQMNFVCNNETTALFRVQAVNVNFETSVASFVCVYDSGASTQHPTCRIPSLKRVITGPIGCSDIGNPEAALQSANCIQNAVDVELRREILYQTWNLAKNNPTCTQRGGNGDIRLCPGPLRLAIVNRDSFLPHQTITVKKLLASTMQFFDTLTGPYAMSRSVVQVRMILPGFTVQTDCVDGLTAQSFSGSYISNNADPNPGLMSDIMKTFVGPFPTLRFYLQRDSLTSYAFRLGFGNSAGTNQNYTYEYFSSVITPDIGEPTFFLNWLYLVQENTIYPMYDVNTGINTCNITSIVFPSSFNYTILEPDSITPANYSLNAEPRLYYKTRVCNYQPCFLTSTGDLTVPYCPEGDVAGGTAVYVDPRDPQLPIYVPPNPYLDFRLNCDEFYPKAATFQDINTIVWPRISFISQMCFSPFLDNDRILANLSPNEKFTQCKKLGMNVCGRAQSVCCWPPQLPLCPLHWIFFDQNCFYRFDPVLESKFSTSVDQAEFTCRQFDSESQDLVAVDDDLETWLTNYFLFWKNTALANAAYRFPKPGQPLLCNCLVTSTLTLEDCPCQTLTFPNDETGVPIFPICFLTGTVAKNRIQYPDLLLSLDTARLWVQGQEGPFPGGYEATCNCFDGYAGKSCEIATCQGADLILKDPGTLQQTGTFLRDCAIFGHGQCSQGNPRVCQCMPQWGPDASILSTLSWLYTFRNVPCVCPASSAPGGRFQINDVIYNVTGLTSLVCGGVDRGICYAQNATAPGYCGCLERYNQLTSALEPAYQGHACVCRVPIQPYLAKVKNGPIVSSFCNNKGTCCPSGQTIDDPVGNKYADDCYTTEEGEPIDGCVCNNGWGGTACTCPAPFDYAEGKVPLYFEGDSSKLYVDMGFPYFIRFVRLSGCSSSSSLVAISREVGKASESSDCTFYFERNSIFYYYCIGGETLAYPFVFVQEVETPDTCVIKAFTQNYTLCGETERVNMFSGRFFDIPLYRDNGKTLEEQYINTSTFGCTTTDCMCNSNWTGPLCATGVSSIRPILIEEFGVERTLDAKLVCGETVSLPALLDSVQGRGQPDGTTGCVCNPISSLDPTGKLGPVVEKFVGPACECATTWNEDYTESMLCSHHGHCLNASFSYGQCENDLLSYREDALFAPFVQVADTINTIVAVTLAADSYFLAPYTWRTPSPTHSPTLSPTLKPTSLSPSLSPTKPQFYLYLFYCGVNSTGVLGGLTAISSTCNANKYNDTDSNKLKSTTTCVQTTALLCSSTRPLSSLATLWDFPASTTPLLGPRGQELSTSWSLALSGSGTVLDQDINVGNVISTDSLTRWSGCTTTGATSNTCVDWGFSFVGGAVGSMTSTTPTWLTSSVIACSVTRPVLGICLSTQPHSQPTTAPTKSPTNSPTTLSPTQPQMYLYIFYCGVISNGNLGGLDTISNTCNSNKYDDVDSNKLKTTTTCTQTTALLSNNTRALSSLSTLWNFPSTSTPLLGPRGQELSTSWSLALSGSGTVLDQNALENAIFISGHTTYWTGSTTTGGSSILSCNSWTTSIFSGGQPGSMTSTTSSWLTLPSISCSLSRPVLGICLSTQPPSQPTTAPTMAPTSPTKSPTSPTSSPTMSPIVVFYATTPTSFVGSAIGSAPTSDGFCNSIKPFVCGASAGKALLRYTSRPTVSIFPSSSSVVGPTGTLIAPAYGSIFTASPSAILTNTLQTAGVFSPTVPTYWSGGYGSSNNCMDWSNIIFMGTSGNPASLTGAWYQSATGNACTMSFPYLCGCSISPTMSPTSSTSSPTSPTASPTLSPTKSPTRSPTKFPTHSPTRSPTRSPTKSPTRSPTRFPTNSPTRSPTQSPTASPTPQPSLSPTSAPFDFEHQRVMYRLLQGTPINVVRIVTNVLVEEPNNFPPVNLTIQSNAANMEPIAWENMLMRVYDVSSNTTITVSAWPSSGVCNPANPAVPPGSLNIVQDDGVYACATTIKCALTNDCTDDLTPRASAVDGYAVFPDVRACYCSHGITVYPNAGTLPITDFTTVKLWSGNMTINNPLPPPAGLLGQIFCNNFIDRELNCQLQRLSVAYQASCLRQPITCTSMTLGRFFGGFYNQNPLFQYPSDQSTWGEGQYMGIASVMNYLVYMTEADGDYLDPFTVNIFNAYYWLNLSDGTLVGSTNTSFSTGFSYQSYLIQGDPDLYDLNSSPPPFISTSTSSNLLYETSFTSIQSCQTNIQATITSPIATFPPTSTCYDLTWHNVTSGTAQDRLSGLEYYFAINSQHVLLSVALRLNATIANLTGIEVYNQHRDLCGGVYTSNISTSEVYTFICVNTDTANITTSNPFIVRLLGVSSYYDQPEMNIDTQYRESLFDPLASILSWGNFWNAFRNLSLPLFGSLTWDLFNNIGDYSRFPTRPRFDAAALLPTWDTNTGIYAPFTLVINTTAISGNTSFSSQNLQSAWFNVSQAIYANNTYPWNVPLWEAKSLYYTRPVNLSSEDDLAYLRQIYDAWLSPRYCGDDTDCQTIEHGTCVFPESPFDRRWRQIGETASYIFKGDEGGCECWNTFDKGFFNPALNCQRCKSGLGPNTLSELSAIIQYNNDVVPTFDAIALGISVLGNITPEQAEQSYLCRFPTGVDPVIGSLASINFCAGHGLMQNFSSDLLNVSLVIFTEPLDPTHQIYIGCLTLLSSSDDVYTLQQDLIQDFEALIYINEVTNATLTIIGSIGSYTIYKNGDICSFECSQEGPNGLTYLPFPRAWTCTLTCEEEEILLCQNDLFLTPEAPATSNATTFVSLDEFRWGVVTE